MPDPDELSDLQLAILRVVWSRGEATVNDVHAAIQDDRKLAVSTVATVMSRLDKSGILTHRTEGRQFVYRARVSEPQVRESMIQRLVRRFFRGDPAALAGHLLSEGEIQPGDLERVREIIEEHRREGDDD